MDLPGWIPSYRTAKGHGGVAPTADQITIDSVLDVADNHIDFTGISGVWFGDVHVSNAGLGYRNQGRRDFARLLWQAGPVDS